MLDQPAAAPRFYEGFEEDRQALRKTAYLSGADISASSGEAIQAAQRIFENVNFIGMTKDEVLEILGDPGTISDYGEPARPELDDPLIYHFDSGYHGLKYTLEFEGGRAVSVARRLGY